MFCPVGQFMRQRGIIRLGRVKALERGHLHIVARATVIGLISAMTNIGILEIPKPGEYRFKIPIFAEGFRAPKQ